MAIEAESGGGRIGLWLTVDHPELVERLVLAAVASETPPDSPMAERMARWIELGEAGEWGTFFANMAQLMKAATEEESGSFAAAARLQPRPATPERFIGELKATLDPSSFVTGRLGEIAVPALVLAGELDQVVPLAVDAAGGRADPRRHAHHRPGVRPYGAQLVPRLRRPRRVVPGRAGWMIDEPAGRWGILVALSATIVLALVPWFSAAAVAPLIAAEWRIDGLQTALLTVAVQVGFSIGALVLALTGAADVVPARRLIAIGALVAAAANAAFGLLAVDLATAIPLRALSGAGIAAVYPVAMKVLAGWFGRERGLAVGVLIGAITLGSAIPYALRAAGAVVDLDWRLVVVAGSIPGVLAAAIAWATVRDGPLAVPAARFSVRQARAALAEPSVRLANLGYLGHMWELYAMWTWVPAFLAASLALSGDVTAQGASAVAFLVVAAGAMGCIAAGALADRLGRTTLTIAAMALSGTSAIVAGLLFGAPTALVLAVVVVWGITVVADSAQFSTAISELAPPGTAGSALALQTAAGFLLTSVTIVGVGLIDPASQASWALAFGILALGPLVGIVAMWRLRRRPEAVRMAGGRR